MTPVCFLPLGSPCSAHFRELETYHTWPFVWHFLTEHHVFEVQPRCSVYQSITPLYEQVSIVWIWHNQFVHRLTGGHLGYLSCDLNPGILAPIRIAHTVGACRAPSPGLPAAPREGTGGLEGVNLLLGWGGVTGGPAGNRLRLLPNSSRPWERLPSGSLSFAPGRAVAVSSGVVHWLGPKQEHPSAPVSFYVVLISNQVGFIAS